MAFAALSVTGCGAGEDMMAPLAMSTSQINDTDAQSGELSDYPDQPVITEQQRGYLDALKAAGVTPSSDLHALSIGSYVCQARAARQNDQAVWDFVLLLVRSDVRAAHSSEDIPLTGEVNEVTSDYIRIATERLC